MKIGIEHRWMILTGGDKTFFFVALPQDSGSWPPLTRFWDHTLDKPHFEITHFGQTTFWDHTHWTNHIRYESSEGEISPTQKFLPDNTQHSQQTDSHASGRIRTRNPRKRAAANPRLSTTRTPGTADREPLGESPVPVPSCPSQMNWSGIKSWPYLWELSSMSDWSEVWN
jgi:hypothetical protein